LRATLSRLNGAHTHVVRRYHLTAARLFTFICRTRARPRIANTRTCAGADTQLREHLQRAFDALFTNQIVGGTRLRTSSRICNTAAPTRTGCDDVARAVRLRTVSAAVAWVRLRQTAGTFRRLHDVRFRPRVDLRTQTPALRVHGLNVIRNTSTRAPGYTCDSLFVRRFICLEHSSRFEPDIAHVRRTPRCTVRTCLRLLVPALVLLAEPLATRTLCTLPYVAVLYP